jgi:hypothetical protein
VKINQNKETIMSTTVQKDTYKNLIGPGIEEEPFYYIKKIETTFINENMNFHPNTWDNISLRWRTLIDEIPEKGVRIVVGLTREEMKEFGIDGNEKETSIFGSYNRATICDIRCTGELKKVTGNRTQEYLKSITDRLLEIEKLNIEERKHPAKLPESYIYSISGVGPDEGTRAMIRTDIENIESFYFMFPKEMGYSIYQK